MIQKQDSITKQSPLLLAGQVTSRKWLEAQGIQGYTIDNYVKGSRLTVLEKGVYALANTKVSWQSLVASLPRLVDEPAVVGGLTALELQGFAQYLQLGGGSVVNLHSRASCPRWLMRLFGSLNVELRWHTTGLLWTGGTPRQPAVRDWVWREDDPTLSISAPEQALLELLLGIPDQVSFEHADQIMEGLTQLSPSRVTALLGDCRSVKVKRLFFWLADRHPFPWRKHLVAENFDLGSGKRVLQPKGKLDGKYLITVPGGMTNAV